MAIHNVCMCVYVCVHVCVCLYVCVHVCTVYVCMCMQRVYGPHPSIDGTRENTKSLQTPLIKAAQQCSAAFIQHISLSSCYQDLRVDCNWCAC